MPATKANEAKPATRARRPRKAKEEELENQQALQEDNNDELESLDDGDNEGTVEFSDPRKAPKPEWVSESEVPPLRISNYGVKQRHAADVTAMLEAHMGRWLKIHRDYVSPTELYNLYNKEKGDTDTKVTVRGWSRAKRGDADFYYATIISGGLQGRIE